MNEQDIQKVLSIILRSVKDCKFIWRLEGSANLKIQGVNTSVKDLDITTNDEGLNIFRKALKKYIIKDFFSQKIDGYSLICSILNFEIEINSYGDRKLGLFDKTKIVLWNNLEIPILPLEYAKEFYTSINRKDKVELIEQHLKQK